MSMQERVDSPWPVRIRVGLAALCSVAGFTLAATCAVAAGGNTVAIISGMTAAVSAAVAATLEATSRGAAERTESSS